MKKIWIISCLLVGISASVQSGRSYKGKPVNSNAVGVCLAFLQDLNRVEKEAAERAKEDDDFREFIFKDLKFPVENPANPYEFVGIDNVVFDFEIGADGKGNQSYSESRSISLEGLISVAIQNFRSARMNRDQALFWRSLGVVTDNITPQLKYQPLDAKVLHFSVGTLIQEIQLCFKPRKNGHKVRAKINSVLPKRFARTKVLKLSSHWEFDKNQIQSITKVLIYLKRHYMLFNLPSVHPLQLR